MEYKRPGVGLKIYREALARFTEFSNLRLGVYTPYAHENSNQSLNKHQLGLSSYEVLRLWVKGYLGYWAESVFTLRVTVT